MSIITCLMRWYVLRCLFHCFNLLQVRNSPCCFVCGVGIRDAGAANVCMAHSLMECILRLINSCASIHSLGGKVVVSCSELTNMGEVEFDEFS